VVGSASAIGVKICGLTRVDEALACLNAGADWIGLNFHPGSPRFVDPARAREIITEIREPSRVVGVFVDRPTHEVANLAEDLALGTLQLHGHEPPQDLLALARFRIIRAFRLASTVDIQGMIDFLDCARSLGRAPDAVLVDAAVPGQAGGTGTLVADDLLDLMPIFPHLILAGGLCPENVAERVRRVRPWMVDVASGVESSPGRKDPAKVVAFIRASRSVLHDELVDNPRPQG
jgi:phosphoribosylanthranilate isomerase